jgi:hypothetical protein
MNRGGVGVTSEGLVQTSFLTELSVVGLERGGFAPILEPSLEITKNLRFFFLALITPHTENMDISFRKVKGGKTVPDRADTSWEEGS